MFASLFQFLHVAPLAVIVLSLLAYLVLRVRGVAVNGEGLIGLVVALCAVGISSGSVLHHDEVLHVFDPCIGYSLALVGVAVAMLKRSSTVKSAL